MHDKAIGRGAVTTEMVDLWTAFLKFALPSAVNNGLVSTGV